MEYKQGDLIKKFSEIRERFGRFETRRMDNKFSLQ